MKKAILLFLVSVSVFAQKKDFDASLQLFDIQGRGLMSNSQKSRVFGEYYENPRGSTEYSGNDVYVVNSSIGYAEKIPNKTYFNQIRFKGYGNSTTEGYLAVYKYESSTLPSAPFNLSGFKLIGRKFLGAGEWKTSSSDWNIVRLDKIDSVEAGHHIICLMQSTKGTFPTSLRWTSQSSTTPNRIGLIFNTSGDATSLSTSYFYGGANWLSTPPILEVTNTYFESKLFELILPKNIYVATDTECNIYKDQVFVTSENSVTNSVVYSATTGTHYERNYRVTPTSTTTITLTTSVLDKSLNVVSSKNTTIVPISKTTGTGSTKNVLVIGDSFISANTIVQTIKDNADASGGYTFTMIGTKGSPPYNHEGIAGWTWSQFNGASSPFYFSGAINFQTYCSTNSFAGIDIAIINLGTNDVFSGAKTVSDINTIMTTAKAFIDRLLLDYPSCKIVIALPTSGGSQDGFGINYGAGQYIEQFKLNMRLYNKTLIEIFDNNRYNSAVRVSPAYLWVDKYFGFPRANVAASSREPTLINISGNGVHPSESGYKQYGDCLWSTAISF